jgi:hypothetical protein
MQKQIGIRRVDACAVQCVLNAINESAVCGQRFSEHQLALSFVEGGQIGECPTDIDSNPETALGL